MNAISITYNNLDTNNCNCIIEELLVNKFSSKTYNDKLMIVNDGRPQPDVLITTKAKNCIRKFSKDQYKKTKWLTACPNQNKFYCWPCILFNNDVGKKFG